MDYLEGSLLHAWWSDTDYESRKHTGTWLWLSFFSFLAIALAAVKLNLDGTLGLFEEASFWRTIGLVLFFLTPFLCLVYYKLPFILRIPVLALLLLKYVAFFILFVSSIASLLVIPPDFELGTILDWGNSTFGNFLESTSSQLGVTGLFVGGAVLVLIGIAIALVILALIIFVPILLLKALNAFQYLYDTAAIWASRNISKLSKTYKSIPSSTAATSGAEDGKPASPPMAKSGTKVSRPVKPANNR